MAALRLLTLVLTLSLPGAALLSLSMGSWGPVTALCFAPFVIFSMFSSWCHRVVCPAFRWKNRLANGGWVRRTKPLVLGLQAGSARARGVDVCRCGCADFRGHALSAKMAISSGRAVLNAVMERLFQGALRFTHTAPAANRPCSLGCTRAFIFAEPRRLGHGADAFDLFSTAIFALLSRALRPDEIDSRRGSQEEICRLNHTGIRAVQNRLSARCGLFIAACSQVFLRHTLSRAPSGDSSLHGA